MGAWGTGNFDNDTALDFNSLIEAAEGPDAVLACIQSVAEVGEEEYLDADPCCELLVAAEYVAAALGRPLGDDEHADQVRNTVSGWSWKPTRDEVALCVVAIRRVATDSELAELWADSAESGEEWAGVVEDLLVRLGERGF